METVTHPSLAFPKLSVDQVQSLSQIGQKKTFKDGQALWKEGDREVPVYIILSGVIEIVQHHGQTEYFIVRHEPGEFTGEIAQLTGSIALVEGRAIGETETLVLDKPALKRVIVEYSSISDILLKGFLERRAALIEYGQNRITLIGSRHSVDLFRIREFLDRNAQPYTWLDLERDETVQEILIQFGIAAEETPVLISPSGRIARNPTNEEMASCIGLTAQLSLEIVDLVVIGAGPAGLAASVYGASEGLSVWSFEKAAPGGQAGTSSKIENYLGFPTGISGTELAQRAWIQARKFGAEISVPESAQALRCEKGTKTITLGQGREVRARAVVVATGAEYRRLPFHNIRDYEGRGVYYGATHMEAQLCVDEEVAVVGGGNSAGQATVFLANSSKKVHLIVRREDLSLTMSQYLIRRLAEIPNVEIHASTEIIAISGEEELKELTLRNVKTGATQRYEVCHLFSFIGADPRTQWMCDAVVRDEKGFVKTGPDLSKTELASAGWSLTRSPMLLETSVPGVFAAGDVRYGSTKRVASAVGEGSIAVSLVHRYLERI